MPMVENTYLNTINFLKSCSSDEGFLASAQAVTNYKRVWARDGVICGLAALATKNHDLIKTFQATLHTLAKHQHVIGTIPSNVACNANGNQISYGGLAGRVDAQTWFIIGVCQYAFVTNNPDFYIKYKSHIFKCLKLLESWEFNNNHLVYVPLSGNWADEYVTDGYTLYDQVLRIWALKCVNYFEKQEIINQKIEAITHTLESNFIANNGDEKIHPKAFVSLKNLNHLPCSLSPAGYKTYFDTLGHALFMLLNLGDKSLYGDYIKVASSNSEGNSLGLVPCFWPPITEDTDDWNLLKNNCKYEFRNWPYQFHNGGLWPMVNAFWGWAVFENGLKKEAVQLLKRIGEANQTKNNGFFENFDAKSNQPNGVKHCAWSGAGYLLLHQIIKHQIKFLK